MKEQTEIVATGKVSNIAPGPIAFFVLLLPFIITGLLAWQAIQSI